MAAKHNQSRVLVWVSNPPGPAGEFASLVGGRPWITVSYRDSSQYRHANSDCEPCDLAVFFDPGGTDSRGFSAAMDHAMRGIRSVIVQTATMQDPKTKKESVLYQLWNVLAHDGEVAGIDPSKPDLSFPDVAALSLRVLEFLNAEKPATAAPKMEEPQSSRTPKQRGAELKEFN